MRTLDTPGLLDRRVYRAGKVLFNEGEAGDRAYLVETGRIDIHRVLDGHRRLLGRVGPGGIFGEMALIDDKPRMATALVAEDATCVVIKKSLFEEKLRKSDPFIVALLRIFVVGIRSVEQRIDDIQKQAHLPDALFDAPVAPDPAAPAEPAPSAEHAIGPAAG